jgi:Zn-dependent protease with chaperone function
MATNFFDQQDAARRQTGILVVYFVLAVVAIIAAVYLAVSAILFASQSHGVPQPLFDPQRLGAVALVVALVILLGTLYKIAVLQEGGAAVARLLGGRLVDPATSAHDERRLLNVVEEMALASGTPVPSVYVLDGETGINAFAAGFGPGDAVITVSRGCLDHLTRDELQGVVAHEFSHLLNGDMKLNLRLMGLLYGILMLALIGQLMMRFSGTSTGSSSSRRSNDKDGGNSQVAFLMLGLALVIIGWVGVFFGRLIKAAISRQREFLADASAVQFTRNPDGIAGALKKIGGLAEGSRIKSPHAEEACHLFFSAGVSSLSSLLATHPPLVERIRRIDPSFDGQFVPTVLEPQEAQAATAGADSEKPTPSEAVAALIPLDSSAAVASVGAPQRAHVDFAARLVASLPDPLLEAVREPFSACAVVYTLLLDRDLAIRQVQIAHLQTSAEPGTVPEIARLEPLIVPLGDAVRLPLVELALPALRALSGRQYQQFRDRIDFLVASDQKVSLFEFALQRMLRRHLDRQFTPRRPPAGRYRYAPPSPLPDHLAVLLSSLAHAGHVPSADELQAFRGGMARFGIAPDARALLPDEACSLPALDRALDRLASSAPQVKSRVLDACAACIASDGTVTIAEGEMLRAIADSLDCPIPPLLAEAGPLPLPLSNPEPTRASTFPS